MLRRALRVLPACPTALAFLRRGAMALEPVSRAGVIIGRAGALLEDSDLLAFAVYNGAAFAVAALLT